MNIRLDKKWGIKTDSHNFILYQVVTIQSGERKGEEDERGFAYYGTLEKAITGYVKYCSRLDTEKVKTVKDMAIALDKINVNINKFIKEFKGENNGKC